MLSWEGSCRLNHSHLTFRKIGQFPLLWTPELIANIAQDLWAAGWSLKSFFFCRADISVVTVFVEMVFELYVDIPWGGSQLWAAYVIQNNSFFQEDISVSHVICLILCFHWSQLSTKSNYPVLPELTSETQNWDFFFFTPSLNMV